MPTETWREHVARRQRCLELWEKLARGAIHEINDLITDNLDIRQFAEDAIAGCEGPDLLRAFYNSVTSISVLDPTCGSGAFLFAALNILQPLYEACLGRMSAFVSDADALGKPSPKTFDDFRKILAEAAKHPSRDYFVLKSIIVRNLYGVDIMEEAVEICKLRLFLKLVSQVDRVEQLEPLPDIDFNIRAGNTLVGFVTLSDVKKSVAGTLGFDQTEVDDIVAEAKQVARLFKVFQHIQEDAAPEGVALAKADLRARGTDLAGKLDRYLATVYGADPELVKRFAAWRKSHQPFHWFAEFYGIMAAGGFDVVIGNPPYVEYSEVKATYQVLRFAEYGNLHAMTTQRCIELISNESSLSLIVPVALPSTERFEALRTTPCRESMIWTSHFDFRPSKLFEGANQRLTVFVRRSGIGSHHFTTRYNRWSAEERPCLFETMYFSSWNADVTSLRPVWPKIAGQTSKSILGKVAVADTPVASLLGNGAGHFVFYKNTGMLYFTTFTLRAPECYINGVAAPS